MAASMHDDILIDTDLVGLLPVNGYSVSQRGFSQRPFALATSERSLTGQLQVHRVNVGADPYIGRDHMYELLCSRAEKDLVEADRGKVVYFMPHWRDNADIAYRFVMLLETTSATQLDPMGNWWALVVMLTDATGLAVG